MSSLPTESSMTIAFAIAITLHAVPLLLADPELDPPITYDETIGCFGCDGVCDDEPPPDLDEPVEPMRLDGPDDFKLSREQAIEAARIGGIGSFRYQPNVGAVGVLGDPAYEHHPLTPRTRLALPSFDDGEIYTEERECDWWCYRSAWNVRQHALLSPSMSAPVAPALSIYPIQLAGGLDKATVRLHLKRHLSELARCQAETQPSLRLGGDTGELGLVFTQILIGRDGRVRQVIVRHERDEVVDCVTRAFKAIEFPRPPNGELTQVNVPLRYGTIVASAGVLVR